MGLRAPEWVLPLVLKQCRRLVEALLRNKTSIRSYAYFLFLPKISCSIMSNRTSKTPAKIHELYGRPCQLEHPEYRFLTAASPAVVFETDLDVRYRS